MKHSNRICHILFVFLILGGCANPVLKDLNLKPDECLFFGKIKLNYLGEAVDPKSLSVSFCEFGDKCSRIPIGPDGRLAGKVKLTNNFLGTLFFTEGFVNRFTKFNNHSLLIMPLEAGKAYYIGDVTFNLDKENSDSYSAGGGIAGAMVANAVNIRKPFHKVHPQIDSLNPLELAVLKLRYPTLPEVINKPLFYQ